MKTPICLNNRNFSWLLVKLVIEHWPPNDSDETNKVFSTCKAKAIVEHSRQNGITNGGGSGA
jgi:hypothetical protein